MSEPTIEYDVDGCAACEAEKVALEAARKLAEENANVRVKEWFQAHLRPCSLCGGRSIGYATSLAITIGHPPSPGHLPTTKLAPGEPTIATTCETCGKVEQFSARVMGVWP